MILQDFDRLPRTVDRVDNHDVENVGSEGSVIVRDLLHASATFTPTPWLDQQAPRCRLRLKFRGYAAVAGLLRGS